jgi:hypothetical protein
MRKPDGSPYSRQRVEQIEAEGRRKLGLPQSIATAVHGAERAGRALNLMAGGLVGPSPKGYFAATSTWRTGQSSPWQYQAVSWR